MKFYIFTLFIIFISFSREDIGNHNTWNTNDNPNCEPGCANIMSKECNKFEIQLRATMVKCNKIKSPFKPTSTAEKSSDCTPVCEFKCIKKLHAVIKLINEGETITFNQYIIIDHVIDSVTGQKVSLLNPYVVVLKQKPLMQLYGLKYRNIVNGEASEQVLNKKDPNFTGCDDISDNPTCGNIRFNGDVVPYSQGFCCSCDDEKNMHRQPRNTVEKGNLTKDIHNLIYHEFQWNNNIFKHEVELPRKKKSVEPRDFNDYRTSIRMRGKSPVIYVQPKIIDWDNYKRTDLYKNNFHNYETNNYNDLFQERFDNKAHNIQIRGGQDCDDTFTSKPRANPVTYQDSAHCLKFSKVWYAIYQLSDPVLDHTLYIKIFEKREKIDGTTVWIDFTGCKTITVGTLHNKYEDCFVKVTYECGIQQGDTGPFALDPKCKKILIPQSMPEDECDRHPECQSGPTEYLVVDDDKIQTGGDQCNTAGVGYAAFYNQPRRCQVPRGSCLGNQPSQLWRQDKITCRRSRRGSYFLKNFARVPDDALRKTRKGDSKYLALHYSTNYKSTLEIELNADDNMIFRSMPIAKILEIYVDSTSDTATILTIKIFNNGLTSNIFRPRLTDCPLELPVEWGNLEGDSVLIPPQHHSTFVLRLLGILPVNNFYCSVEALSSKNEIVAVRRIRIIKHDRCICSWHCLCACYKETGLGCVLMSLEHYKAAGFIGSMPMTTNMVHVSKIENAVFGFLFFVMLLIIILLFMGFTKALIGLCFFVPVGIWGLDMIIGLRQLDRYYEPELMDRSVEYDEDGWPVNPDNGERNVRIVEPNVEFCLNVIFFFTYPIMILLYICKKFACPYYSYTGDEDKDFYFERVSTVSYTKCPPSKQLSCSESECNDDMFDFADEDVCPDD